MHRPPTLAALGALCVLAAGCGSSATPYSTSTAGHASQAAFSAYARSVNLRAGDLPGDEPGPAEQEREEREAGSQSPVARCIGAPNRPHDVLRVSSPTLGDPKGLSAASAVSTDLLAPSNPSAFDTQRAIDLRIYRSDRAAACNANALLGKLRSQGLQHATAVPLANPLSGKDGTIAYRVLIKGDLPPTGGVSKATQVYVDVVLLFVGRTAIEMEMSDMPNLPPAATERRLVELLRERAKSHSF